MEIGKLMSGIAVVIDDAVECGAWSVQDAAPGDDLINRIVDWFERNWNLSFVKALDIPGEEQWENLLRAASFVLLDWRLWGDGGDAAKRHKIAEIVSFLRAARGKLVPVFIFTNDEPSDVTAELPEEIYREEDARRSFVFVRDKVGMWADDSVDVGVLKSWVDGNASVYALKTWDRVLDEARNELFHAMCGRSMDWPRVFWDTYRADGAEPSASLTNLINESLRGRVRLNAFETEHLEGETEGVGDVELRELIAETSFRRQLPEDEIRCGDLYRGSGGKYWLNLRPDCDCIPRDGGCAGDVELHCVQGKKLGPAGLSRAFDADTGSFGNGCTRALRSRLLKAQVWSSISGSCVY